MVGVQHGKVQMKNNKWIQKANLKKGAFTAKAKKRGMTAQQFASKVLASPGRYDSKTVKQARLAKTFKKMAK